MKEVKIEKLKDQIFQEVTLLNHEVLILKNATVEYSFVHIQDCCESVYIESVEGNLLDLVGVPLLLVEEVQSQDTPENYTGNYDYSSSFTWTFYRFGTVKGYVTVRWLGTSNGYYSEYVSIFERSL